MEDDHEEAARKSFPGKAPSGCLRVHQEVPGCNELGNVVEVDPYPTTSG